ncbi:DUF2079 domain-containing protein [Patescibacteria group bacterium]
MEKTKKTKVFSKKELILLISLFVLSALYFCLLKLWLFDNLKFTADSFIFHQMINNAMDGGFFSENTYGNHFGIHTYFIIVFFIPLTLLFKSVISFYFAYAILFASGIFPVYAIVKHLLKRPQKLKINAFNWNWLIPTLSALIYLFLPFHQFLLADLMHGFHFDSLFLPLFVWAFYFLIIRKNRLAYFIFFALVLLVKEEMAIYMATFGIFLLFKKEFRKTGIYTIISSIIFFILAALLINYCSSQAVLAPEIVDWNKSLFKGYGDSYLEIGFNIITTPSAYLNENVFNQFIKVSKPYYFIGFLSPEILVLTFPKIIIGVITGKLTGYPWHYAPVYTFSFLAFLMALGRIMWFSDKIEKFKQLYAKILIAIIVLIIATQSLWAFVDRWDHSKIITQELEPDIQEISELMNQVIPKMDPDALVMPYMLYMRYFQNFNTINFSPGEKRIEMIKEFDPDYFVVQLNQEEIVQRDLIEYYQETNGHEYQELERNDYFVVLEKL